MKLASYLFAGKEEFGAVVGDGVVAMNRRLGGEADTHYQIWVSSFRPTAAVHRRLPNGAT